MRGKPERGEPDQAFQEFDATLRILELESWVLNDSASSDRNKGLTDGNRLMAMGQCMPDFEPLVEPG